MDNVESREGAVLGRIAVTFAVEFIFLAIQTVIYALAILPCVPFVKWLVGVLGLWCGLALGIAISYPLASIGIIAAAAVLRALLGGRLQPGTYPLNSPETHKWLRNLAFYEIARRSPFFPYVHHYSFLAYLFYRLMGARVAWDVHLGYNVQITDPWMTRIDHGATVGNNALLAGHWIQDGELVLNTITVERNALVGGMAGLGPGTCVGNGAILAAFSALMRNQHIPSGEVWGGIPARRVPIVRSGIQTSMSSVTESRTNAGKPGTTLVQGGQTDAPSSGAPSTSACAR